MISVPHDRIVIAYLDPGIDRESALATAYLASLDNKCTEASILGRKRKKGYPLEIRLENALYQSETLKLIDSIGEELVDYSVVWPPTDWEIWVSVLDDKKMFSKTGNLISYIKDNGGYDELKIGEILETRGRKTRPLIVRCTCTEDILDKIKQIYGKSLISYEVKDENLVDEPYTPPFNGQDNHTEDVPEPEHPVTRKTSRNVGILFGDSYLTFEGGDDTLFPLHTEIVHGEKRLYLPALDVGVLPGYVSVLKKTTEGIKNIHLHFRKPGMRMNYSLDGKPTEELFYVSRDLVKRYVKHEKGQIRLKKDKRLRSRKRRKTHNKR